MRILILTQYFPPETGAPQNRLFEIASRLVKAGDEVTVLTAMPNYPKNQIFSDYKGKLFFREEMDGIKLFRAWIYVGKSRSVMARLFNYFSFVFTSLLRGLFIRGRYDYVLCESPPLFLGITAVILSRFKRARLIFNVSDLWPESAEKLGIISNKVVLRMAERLELWLYRKSSVISGQTQGIVANISSRTDRKDIIWLPNGVDSDLYDPNKETGAWRQEQGFLDSDFLIFYAGIIGYAQGLEVIVKAAGMLREEPNIKFILIGDGPEKEKLMAMTRNAGLNNLVFLPNQPKAKMPAIIKACDASVIPLKRLPLFLGAIPSKLFEVLAMKKPILLGVEGEAKQLFIDQGKSGLAFEPENAQDLANKAMLLYSGSEYCALLGENGYRYVREKFNRNLIAERFRKELLLRLGQKNK
ncbi:MAG: glycosyltransferase family 4 protein [Flavobacteriales bacterium]